MTSSNILSDPVSYAWSQTDDQVSVSFLVPKTFRSRDAIIELHTDELHAGLRGTEPILKGKLYAQIRTSDSVWQIESASESTLVDSASALTYQLLTVHLEKLIRGLDWPVVVIEPAKGSNEVDIASRFYLGKMYESIDPVKAFEYYISAAKNDHIASQLKLAAMYEIGKEKSSIVVVYRNIEKSFYWHLQAAKNGNAEANYIVGTSYSNGHGVEKSYLEAIKYFKKAMDLAYPSLDGANHESDSSQARGYYAFFVNSAFRTGLMYLEGGNGIAPDPSLALEFWKQSAATGHAQSMYNTGILYLNGVGTEKNLDEASRYIQNAIELDPKLKLPEALVNYKKPADPKVEEVRRSPMNRTSNSRKSKKYAPADTTQEPRSVDSNESQETESEEELKATKGSKPIRRKRKARRSRSESTSKSSDDGLAWFLLGSLAAFALGLVAFSVIRRPAGHHPHTVPRSVSRSVAGVQVI
ncbi:hypothetical protein K7432_001711 [Basidiobolus ranarum]|uniref:CS domain-containing protein n=1 Tax=Basidiobolus ranarum TaxID=34480 RepID=A0ABR2W924_9FUNG